MSTNQIDKNIESFVLSDNFVFDSGELFPPDVIKNEIHIENESFSNIRCESSFSDLSDFSTNTIDISEACQFFLDSGNENPSLLSHEENFEADLLQLEKELHIIVDAFPKDWQNTSINQNRIDKISFQSGAFDHHYNIDCVTSTLKKQMDELSARINWFKERVQAKSRTLPQQTTVVSKSTLEGKAPSVNQKSFSELAFFRPSKNKRKGFPLDVPTISQPNDQVIHDTLGPSKRKRQTRRNLCLVKS